MEEEKNDPLLQEGEGVMAICVECEYCEPLQRARCTNADLPVKDFIYGIKHCDDYNIFGNCKGFKAKSTRPGAFEQRESIYESKEDEVLAKI